MRRLAAVAGLTVRTALRVRVFWAVVALLAVVVLVVPPSLRDDGTLVGRMRLLLSYTLGLSHALLCIATVWVGADAIAREVSTGRIGLLATKPIPRWQFWVGKWLGVVSLDAALVCLVGLGVYAQVARTLADPRWPAEQRAELARVVQTARRAVRPETVDFSRRAAEETDRRLRGLSDVQVDREAVFESSLRDVVAAWQSVPAGGAKEWRYEDVRPPPGCDELTIRFRFRAGGYVGRRGAPGRWLVRGSAVAPEEQREVRLQPDSFHSVTVPANLVGPDGVLRLTYENRTDQTLVFPVEDGPTVLYGVAGFAANYLLALFVLWLQLCFLAALGVALGGGFSFPVASFAALSYLAMALHSSLMAGRLAAGRIFVGHHGQVAPDWLEAAAQAALRSGLWLTGALLRDTPIADLSRGLAISDLGATILRLGVLQTGLVAAVGILIWSGRELALGVDE